jgi:ElaB/YqjD/DUF883 family membrane-anchored ribosome-binding protein
MGQDPEEIRHEIEATRSRMEDTVEAIGYKTDVRARTKDKVTTTKDRMMGKVTDVKDRAIGSIVGTKDSATSTLSEATPSSGELKEGVRRTAGMAQENPLGLAVGSVAVGFLAGMLVPATSVEREKVGPMADQAREKVMETGQEALERAGKVVEQIPQAA